MFTMAKLGEIITKYGTDFRVLVNGSQYLASDIIGIDPECVTFQNFGNLSLVPYSAIIRVELASKQATIPLVGSGTQTNTAIKNKIAAHCTDNDVTLIDAKILKKKSGEAVTTVIYAGKGNIGGSINVS